MWQIEIIEKETDLNEIKNNKRDFLQFSLSTRSLILSNLTNMSDTMNSFFLEKNESVTEADQLNITVSLPQAIGTAVALGIIMIGTLFGNILVILSVFTYKPLRNVQNIFLVSLAAADIAVATFVMPFNVAYSIIGKWIFGLHVCELWLTCDVLCCTASILNLCAIALDRYWAIHDPINYAQKRTLNRVLCMILSVWVISTLISVPPLIGWNDWPEEFTDDTPCRLTEDKGYVIYSASGSFYIPLIIMTVVYIRIFQTARNRIRVKAKAAANIMKKDASPLAIKSSATPLKTVSSDVSSRELKTDVSSLNCNSSSIEMEEKSSTPQESVVKENATDGINNDTNYKTAETVKAPSVTVRSYMEQKERICLQKERRAAQVLGIVMGVFVLCWLPFFIMYVTIPFCTTEACGLSGNLVNFITWLGYINSALNPVIYTVFNTDFRRSFQRLLCGK